MDWHVEGVRLGHERRSARTAGTTELVDEIRVRADVDDVDLADSFMPRPSGPVIGLSPANRYQQRTALDVSPDGLGEPVNGRRYPAVLGCRNGGRELSALVLT